jgi:hypothetical protein
MRLELVPAPRPHESGRGELPAWRARLTGAGLDASVVFPEAGWEPQSLADFFAALDHDRRGAEGERRWQSEEVELRLTARHDKTNTVLLRVEMEDGAPPRWRCETDLELDPGIFRHLAADVRRLSAVSLKL